MIFPPVLSLLFSITRFFHSLSFQLTINWARQRKTNKRLLSSRNFSVIFSFFFCYLFSTERMMNRIRNDILSAVRWKKRKYIKWSLERAPLWITNVIRADWLIAIFFSLFFPTLLRSVLYFPWVKITSHMFVRNRVYHAEEKMALRVRSEVLESFGSPKDTRSGFHSEGFLIHVF